MSLPLKKSGHTWMQGVLLLARLQSFDPWAVTPDKTGEHYEYDEDDFPTILGEAYCAGEMEDVPQDLFDL